MTHPPPRPWSQGKSEDYTAFRLTLNICQDNDGNVWSDHDFMDESDQKVCEGLPHGGIPQVAHALLTEAVRREIFTTALVLLTRDPTFMKRWTVADSEVRKVLEQEVARAAEHVLVSTIKKMIPGAVLGVLNMMAPNVEREVL